MKPVNDIDQSEDFQCRWDVIELELGRDWTSIYRNDLYNLFRNDLIRPTKKHFKKPLNRTKVCYWKFIEKRTSKEFFAVNAIHHDIHEIIYKRWLHIGFLYL